MQISMHVITQDNPDKILRLLTATQGCFDTVRVCEGGSGGKTVDICKMFKAQITIRRWDDDMSAQHNTLLKIAKKGEMIFVCDDDEEPSPELIAKFRLYAEESHHGSTYRLVKIPSIMYINGIPDWSVADLSAAILAGEQKDRFTKQNFFWYDGEVRYSGESHYGLDSDMTQDWGVRDMVPEPYFHYKIPEDIIRCNLQQALINCEMQGMSLDDGAFVWSILKEEGIQTTHEVLKYLRRGNIRKALKDWFVDHKDPGLGTVSDFFEYYFLFYHPEELDQYLKTPAFRDFEKEPAVIRHLKDAGGYRSYTVDICHEDGSEHWLPIAHLSINPKLLDLIGTNQILIKQITAGQVDFNLDSFSADNEKVDDPEKEPAVENCRIEDCTTDNVGNGLEKLEKTSPDFLGKANDRIREDEETT